MQQATIKAVGLTLRPAQGEDLAADDRARAVAVAAGVAEDDIEGVALRLAAWVIEQAAEGHLFLFSETARAPLPLRVEFGGE